MSFFISEAVAETAATGGAQGDPMFNIFVMVALFAVFYFLLIRPQAKRAKEHKKMASGLQKGDEVVTSGGVLGKITHVGDDYVSLQIADNVEVKIQRSAVGMLLPKGTIKEVNK